MDVDRVNASKMTLKAVLLHNGNQLQSDPVPVAFPVVIKEI